MGDKYLVIAGLDHELYEGWHQEAAWKVYRRACLQTDNREEVSWAGMSVRLYKNGEELAIHAPCSQREALRRWFSDRPTISAALCVELASRLYMNEYGLVDLDQQWQGADILQAMAEEIQNLGVLDKLKEMHECRC